MDYPQVPYLVKLNSKTNMVNTPQADLFSGQWLDVNQIVEFKEEVGSISWAWAIQSILAEFMRLAYVADPSINSTNPLYGRSLRMSYILVLGTSEAS